MSPKLPQRVQERASRVTPDWLFPLRPDRTLAAAQAEWEQVADQQLTGGFDSGDVCPECHLARSRSGACGC